MYVCRECEQPINQASELCPYCGADLTVSPAEEQLSPPKKRSLAKVFLYWAVVLACLGAIVWYALPLRLSNQAAQAESRALEALGKVQTALHNYAAAEGTYPPTLEVLGQPAREAAQWAQSGGYELQYVPAQPNSEGRVKDYNLTVRSGNYGYRNFYSDDSGVIRATRENRSATEQDPPI